ncbi:MAG TPA: CPBP family intramembrane glutamic endopeptidase [Pirellulales bacterium]|nr:CPBP family intramembrane glutamic endopeptidase [Pirellulales bacterium]
MKRGAISAWITTIVALAAVAFHLVLCANRQLTDWWLVALATAVVVTNAVVALQSRDRLSFGFRLTPIQGWVYWAKVTLILGAIVLCVLGLSAAVGLGILRVHVSPPRHIVDRSQIGPLFVWMCIYAPLTEEAMYRLAICPPATAWFGPKAAIAISGVAFAGAHVLGGNPGPDNQIAGFLLAWAYLKSGSLAVPVALHFLGNLVAFGLQLYFFYWAQ